MLLFKGPAVVQQLNCISGIATGIVGRSAVNRYDVVGGCAKQLEVLHVVEKLDSIVVHVVVSSSRLLKGYRNCEVVTDVSRLCLP